MENNLHLKRITKNEIFDVLRLRYPLSYETLKSRGHQHNVVIFKETIDLLEKYENLLLTVKNNQEPTMTFNENQYKMVTDWIAHLRYSKNILPYSKYLDFHSLKKTTQHLNLVEYNHFSAEGVVEAFNRYLSNPPLSLCYDDSQFGIFSSTVQETDSFFLFLEQVKRGVMGDVTITDHFKISVKESSYEIAFNQALENHKQVYVLCLDVTVRRLQALENDDYGKLYSDYFDKIQQILQRLNKVSNIISFMYRIEPSQEFGLNLHCIFVLNEDKHFAEDTFIAKFENELNTIFSPFTDIFSVRNWNHVVRQKFHKKAVGLIKRGDIVARNECWHWVFSQFFCISDVLRFNFNGAQTGIVTSFSEPQNPTKHTTTVSWKPLNLLEIYKHDTKIFAQRKHLAKPVQDYLHIADLIGAVYLNLAPTNGGNIHVGLMYGWIEVFCETLKTTSTEHFILPSDKLHFGSEPSYYFKIQTRIGRMWGTIYHHFSEQHELLERFDSQVYKSKNLSLFIDFIKNNWIKIKLLYAQPASFQAIEELNNLFTPLKTNLAEHNLTPEMRRIETRIKKCQEYVRAPFKVDVQVLRLQLYFEEPNRQLGQNQQSKILTKFLRVGRAAKPLCWLSGYILRWDQTMKREDTSQQKIYADLTLIFQYQSKLQDIDMKQELEKYLTKFVNGYKEKKDPVGTINAIQHKITFCDILPAKAELNHQVLKIETHNKALRNSFFKNYLPYICGLDLFVPFDVQPSNTKRIKRFTKGKETTTKPKLAKPKDDPQDTDGEEMDTLQLS